MELRWHGEGQGAWCWQGKVGVMEGEFLCMCVIIPMTWRIRLGGLFALCFRRNTVDWGDRPGTSR